MESTSPSSTRAGRGSRRRSTRCRSSACSRTPTRPSSRGLAVRSTSRPSRDRTGFTATCSSFCATTNWIRANRLSTSALFFNKYIPLSNAAGGSAIFTPSNAYGQDQWTLRGDREITANHKLFARLSIVRNREHDPSSFPALGSTHLDGPARNIAAALTSNLRNNMIHEFRISFLYGEYRSTAYFQGQ